MKREAGYLIQQSADFYGDSIAVTDGFISRTFREQNDIAESVASAMRQRGVRPGDKVGLLGWNSLDLLDAWFACEKLGAVRVVMHPNLSSAILREQMRSVPLRMLFIDESLVDCLDGLPRSYRADCQFVIMNGASEDCDSSFAGFATSTGRSYQGVYVDDSQPWIIQFTSGTTGCPKPWCKSLRSWMAVIEQNCLVLDRIGRGGAIDQEDVNLHLHALQSSSGFKTLFPYYVRGARTLLMNPHPLADPIETMCSAMLAEGVSGVLLHGTTFRQWLQHLQTLPPEARAAAVAPLRRVVTSLVGPDLLDLATELIGPIWCHTYGSTEQGSPVTALYSHDLKAWGGRGTVGRLQSPMDELRIVDVQTGLPVPAGQLGEIEIRSEMSIGRYLTNADYIPQTGMGDWLRVGDLGSLDSQGALHFIGRTKDAIPVNQRVLHPWQIEQHLQNFFSVERCVVIRGAVGGPSIHVLVQFTGRPDESVLFQMEELFARIIDVEISWSLRVVPIIPTAEGGVKIDRKNAERLVSQEL